jgi:hypothetical protein
MLSVTFGTMLNSDESPYRFIPKRYGKDIWNLIAWMQAGNPFKRPTITQVVEKLTKLKFATEIKMMKISKLDFKQEVKMQRPEKE